MLKLFKKHKTVVVKIPKDIPPDLFANLDKAITDLKKAVEELRNHRNNLR